MGGSQSEGGAFPVHALAQLSAPNFEWCARIDNSGNICSYNLQYLAVGVSVSQL